MDEKKATQTRNARARSGVRVKLWTVELAVAELKSGKYKNRSDFRQRGSAAERCLRRKARELYNKLADEVFGPAGKVYGSNGRHGKYTIEEATRILREEYFGNVRMFRERLPGAYNFLKKKNIDPKTLSVGIWEVPASTTTLQRRSGKITGKE